MGREIKEKTKSNLLFVTCALLYVVITVVMQRADALGITSYNGVLMACEFALCLLMVRRDHKKGMLISFILMFISMLFVVRAILFMHIYAAMPGLCNNFIYLVTLALLSRQFKIREQESVTDFLTGLLNRRGLYKLLRRKVEDKEDFYILYIDLGNFKFINDNYGHAYGDILMKEMAERMRKSIGKLGTITRIGGDEFVVVLDGKCNPKSVANGLIERIREKTVLSINNSKIDCYLTAYCGVSAYPQDSSEYDTLIKYADIAMYEAAKNKSAEVCFYNEKMGEILKRQMELENLIKKGLEHDYFYLVYQPQYTLEGKKLRGFESLLRMKTPEGEFVSPGEFIPVAEKGDLILQIDDYVLKRAMREYKEIVKDKDLVISINVSAKNIGAIGFPEKVMKYVEETGFPTKNLEIEITEYCLVQSVETTIDNIKILRSYGIQVALDDFGTGYTSLSYLSKMPINLLKIDKSLVDDIETSQKNRDFVQAVVSMGHLMGCEVISEGVESEKQLEILRSQECDFVQGYVWGKPLEYEVAKELSLNA